jgi:uncharacterized protein
VSGAARPGGATVTVAGAGSATAVPDTALLELGVEARGATPAEALDACARALDQVRAALDAEGVPRPGGPPRPPAAGGLGVAPAGPGPGRLPGRGPADGAAGRARPGRPGGRGRGRGRRDGARVHGLGLVVGDPAGVAAAAREAAWHDATARATQYAGLAGLTLGPVLEIRETPPPPPDARPMRLLATEAAPATEPGETVVWAAVTVTWSLHPR